MTLIDTTSSPEAPAGPVASPAKAVFTRGALWSIPTFFGLVASLAAVLALAFARWQIDHAVVPWDSKNQFYPFFRFLADAMRHGAIPLWNPYHFAGHPSVADPQSLIFTPSMMLFALVGPDASMQTFDAVILAHLLAGGIGVLCLARRWAWHPAAGLLAALVFVMGSAAASRLEHTGMIISYSYFPWALWCLQATLDRRSFAWAVATGLAVTLMAIGRDQVAFMFCLALLGIILRAALASGEPIPYLVRRAGVLVCAGAVTLACMIVPILLSLQFIHDSNRPSITYGVALSGSLNPVNMLTMIAPNVFGSLDRVYDYWGPGTGLLSGNDWTDKTDRTIDYMFIGTVPVVLLVWHGLAGGRLLQRGQLFVLALFGFALLYAFGRHTPVFSLIFDWVPGVSLYRRPADANFPMTAALALAVGYLLNAFIAHGLPRPRATLSKWIAWAAPAGTVLGCAALIGGGLAFAREYGHFQASLTALGAAATGALAVCLIFVLGRRPQHRARVAFALVALTAGELLWHNAASPLNAEPVSTYSAYNGLYPPERAGLLALRTDMAHREARGEHPRVELIGVNGSWQNAAMVLKIEDTIGYNPLRISDYERAVGPDESASLIEQRQFPGLFRGYCSRLASMLGIGYLVLDRPLDQLPRHFPRPRADLLYAGERFYVYRLANTAVPRALLVANLTATDSDDVIQRAVLPPFDPLHQALIDDASVPALKDKDLLKPAPTGTGAVQQDPAGSAVIAAYSDNAVRIVVDAARPAVLVLHDLAYPGWTVSVDGVPAPILRMNILFRGVEVPSGHHTVVFTFKPLSLANLKQAALSLLKKRKT